MYYYFLGCMVGTENRNMRMARVTVFNNISRDVHVRVFSPDRAVIEYCKKQRRLVNQPLIPGYLLIETEADLLPIKHLFAGMTPSSYGLVHYADRSIYLRGSDRAFAEWIAENNGHITSSKIKVKKTLNEGMQITVLSGPLRDLKGKIIRIYKDTKVVVEIPFLDQVKRVNLPVEIVKEDTDSSQEKH